MLGRPEQVGEMGGSNLPCTTIFICYEKFVNIAVNNSTPYQEKVFSNHVRWCDKNPNRKNGQDIKYREKLKKSVNESLDKQKERNADLIKIRKLSIHVLFVVRSFYLIVQVK